MEAWVSLFTFLTSYRVAFTMALWSLIAISSDSGRGRKCLRAVRWVLAAPTRGGPGSAVWFSLSLERLGLGDHSET